MEPADVSVLPPPPARVYMGSHEFAICPVGADHPMIAGDEGCTTFDPTAIYYDPERPPRQVFDTIWHELTHALNHAYDLRATSKSSRRNDETVAMVHGRGWTQVFLDNPALLEWLDLATNFIKSEQENVTA